MKNKNIFSTLTPFNEFLQNQLEETQKLAAIQEKQVKGFDDIFKEIDNLTLAMMAKNANMMANI